MQPSSRLILDPSQQHVFDVLTEFRLKHLSLSSKKKEGFFARFQKTEKETLKGIYIYGPVGRGKSLVMDRFFEELQTPDKKRVHFHAFMADLHKQLYLMREKEQVKDPLRHYVKKLKKTLSILCFDEFFVTSVADASLLSRLFSLFLEEGIYIIATSNFHPDDLYKDGLQRNNFLPFIQFLKKNLYVLELDGQQDYRQNREGPPTFPFIVSNLQALEGLWQERTHAPYETQVDFSLQGRRTLQIERQSTTACWLSFETLCETPLGSADYLSLTSHFNEIYLHSFPTLGKEKPLATRRFITFMDTLYEAKGRLIFQSATGELSYEKGKNAFEFQRTLSRIAHMQNPTYPL